MMTVNTGSRIVRVIAALSLMLAFSSCAGPVALGSKSPSYLIVDSLLAASGASGGSTFAGSLNADVLTFVQVTINGVSQRVPTVFNDNGQVRLRLGLKNPGPASSPTAATVINEITVTRYHVQWRRSDKREREGIDIPYSFDGGMTGTINTNGAVLTFELVRHSMKEEPPLSNLISGGGAGEISTIAEITFYGRDQHGNEVSVTGMISVNFGDFGDP